MMERPEIEEIMLHCDRLLSVSPRVARKLCDYASTLEARLEKTEEALKNIKTFADERAECSVYLANIAWACNEALEGLGKEVKEDEPTGD